MDKSVKSFLPDYLKESTSASLVVESSVIDSAPNVVILSTDGYMHEIKAKKIVNSLNLHKEIGGKILCAYLVENEKPLIFYLVHTSNKKLIIIRRWDSRLEVTNVYENVNFFEVYDFFCLGYPQIKIQSVQNSDYSVQNTIVKFPVQNTEAVVDELEYEANLNSVAKSLAEKLQIVNRHVDELTEEWLSVKELCQFNTHAEDFGVLPIDSVKFSLPMEKCTEKMTLINRWIKIIGDKLVLGMKILHSGKKSISALEFKMYEKVIKDYSYRLFFSPSDSVMLNKINLLFSCEKVISSIQHGQEFIIVGAVPVGFFNFPFGKKLQISCYVTSGKLKNYLLRETIEISISDIVDCSNKFFPSLNETCSVEDLLAIKTVKSETRLKIETENSTTDSLESVLKENLRFIEVKNAGEGFYYCISTYLNEVFVAVRPIASSERVWKIILYTSDETQIYFFVNMLYEFLPEYTTILLDED